MDNIKRVLLKLSGEILMGDQDFGIDQSQLKRFSDEIGGLIQKGYELSIVIGGGNIFRGLSGTEKGYDRVKGDQMGMLATVINGMALANSLKNAEIPCRLFTAIKIEPFTEFYTKEKALEALEKGFVNIFTAGTGNPYFTTDSAAALRALETNSDLLLKGTRVDGVFSADPEKDKSARKYDKIGYDQVLNENLNVMDMTAFAMCRDNELPIVVFNINKEGNLLKILDNINMGTLVYSK
jgi:uridylate kinase